MNDIAAEVRAWLEDNWDPDASLMSWREKLVESGWGQPTWPSDAYGRGLDRKSAAVVAAEFERVGAVPVDTAGPRLFAAVG